MTSKTLRRFIFSLAAVVAIFSVTFAALDRHQWRTSADEQSKNHPWMDTTLAPDQRAELVLKEITDCLEKGETVKLSSFGSFMVRKKGQRIGRNPKTGTEVPISPRRVMVFKPSAILKQRINGQNTGNGQGKAE